MTSFQSPADATLLGRFENALERTWSTATQVPNAVRQQVNIAAAEILANIVEHGSRGGRLANVAVEISVGPRQMQIGVTDDGDDPNINLDLVKMPQWHAERGRGLAMAKEVLADLTYRRVGNSNVWTLISKPF
jgi:serine/threonine-protein kinase RsbW